MKKKEKSRKQNQNQKNKEEMENYDERKETVESATQKSVIHTPKRTSHPNTNWRSPPALTNEQKGAGRMT